MDLLKLSAVAHANHHFSSPVSVETLDRVLALSGIAHGWRVIDIGCGPATMAIHLAERYGVEVEAVDRSPVMLQLAQSRLEGQAKARVSLHQSESMDYLELCQPCDMLVSVGAGALVPGAADNAAQLKALAKGVKSGGRLLWGEIFWKTPPSDLLRQATGAVAALYAGHAEYVAAGEAAGLVPLYAAVSSDQEWDEYAWRYASAVEMHAQANPDDAAAATMRKTIAGWRRMYLAEGRDTMGFGLYLFAKP